MGLTDRRGGVPEDWFVDPVRLGVPGVRPPHPEAAHPRAWQSDAQCAATAPQGVLPAVSHRPSATMRLQRTLTWSGSPAAARSSYAASLAFMATSSHPVRCAI